MESTGYKSGEATVPDEKKNDDKEGQTNQSEQPLLTKNQLKKLKRKENWEKVKLEKRKAEKERWKARKRAAREKGEDMGPTRKALKHNRMDKSDCKIQVAIDCSFDQYMSEKDIKMLVKQIQFCYSANRRATSPLQLFVCSLIGKTRERMEDLGDYRGWDLHYRETSYLEQFDKSSIVYLSSESPNILQSMEEEKVYIIGGLVDHNHHKGLCHKIAEEKGLYHAHLPISDYIDMKTRKVLTINHVFEILLRYTESKDWQKAFYSVIPQRKGASLKTAAEQQTEAHISETEKGDNSSDSDKPNVTEDCAISSETVCSLVKGRNSPEHASTRSQHDKANCEMSGQETCISSLIPQSSNCECTDKGLAEPADVKHLT